MRENFYQKRDNAFWQAHVRGFWTKEEAEVFLSSHEDYSGPIPLLDFHLEPAGEKPLFESYCRREDVGPPAQSSFFAARSMRMKRGLDPQSISCVLSGDFELNRIANAANGKRWHQFEGDRIKNPKELLWDIARETLEAVREVHPDLSLSCFRGVLQSWQLFDYFFDVCCRIMRSDPSLDWRVVDNARDYIWGKLGQFAQYAAEAPDESSVGNQGQLDKSRDLEVSSAQYPRSVESKAAAAKVEQYMKERSLEQADFAAESKTSVRTIRNFIKTGRVKRGIFHDIAKAMGQAPDQLLKA
jgi:hypothetical protein